ncbi:MAG TPA: nitroreductase [Firmicutes bacterium]|nr:nitroreductase [Bacillota bacterium]
MNEVIKCLETRRSIRKYKQDQISEEDLLQILEAGTYAATGRGKQSPKIIAVQDADTIKQLSKLNAAVMGTDSDPFYGAPTLIIVLAEKAVSTAVEDGSLVIGNIMTAAHSLGIGSCWIHRAKEVFALEDGKSLLKKWGIDADKYIGIGNCILGYADGDIPEAKPRKQDYIVRI